MTRGHFKDDAESTTRPEWGKSLTTRLSQPDNGSQNRTRLFKPVGLFPVRTNTHNEVNAREVAAPLIGNNVRYIEATFT